MRLLTIFLFISFYFFIPRSIYAEDLNFETTTEGIIDRLTSTEHQNNNVNIDILFNVNSYAILDESIPLLNKLGEALISPKLAGKSIFIKGHTDSDGTESHNLELSTKRSISIKQYLAINYPIKPPNLKVVGLGESSPLVPNTSQEYKRINRRVEIEIDKGSQ